MAENETTLDLILQQLQENGTLTKELRQLFDKMQERQDEIQQKVVHLTEELAELKASVDLLEEGNVEFCEDTLQNKYIKELGDVKKNRCVEIYKVDSGKFYKDTEDRLSIEEEQLVRLEKGSLYNDKERNKLIIPILNDSKSLIGMVVADAENDREREALIKVTGQKRKTIKRLLTNEITAEQRTTYLEEKLTDGLTQLYSREGCEYECLKRTVAAMKQGLPCSLLMIDGDKFHDINEKYGHDAGDKVLQTIANTMKQYTSEENDIVVRDGGDEFFVVLNDCTGLEAYDVGEAIRSAIEALDIVLDDGRIINTTISMGVSEVKYPDNVDDKNVMNIINEYKQIADKRLLAAKKGGGLDKNGRPKERNVVSVTPEIEEQVRQRLAMQVEQKDKDHTPQRAEKDVSSYNARMARVIARSSISKEDVNVFVKTFLKTYNIALSEINDKEYTVTLPNEPARTLRYADGGKALVECLIDSKIGKNVYRAYSEKLDKLFDTQGKTASDKITEIFSRPVHMVAEKDCQWEVLYTMLVTEKETKENVLSSYVSPEDIIHGDKQKGDNEHEL